MDLPLLIPVPPSEVRKTIPTEEWGAILDAWILLTELRLHLPAKDLWNCAKADQFNVPFISSYLAATDARLHGSAKTQTTDINTKKTKQLKRIVFLLLRRYFLDLPSVTDELFDWRILGMLSQCYHANVALKELLVEVWTRYETKISASIERGKVSLMESLSKNGLIKMTPSCATELCLEISRMTILASALPNVGHLLMTGSDYVDALHESYKLTFSATTYDGEELRNCLVANVYVGLTSLLKLGKPNISLLLDQLFTLKVSSRITLSGKEKLAPELLSDLVCSTDILVRIERYLVSTPQKRGQDLVNSLREYRHHMASFHLRHYQRHKRKMKKGKSAAEDDGVHAHKLSLVSQIRDLFPDLGDGYVVRLLDYYDDNVETIVAHLLENSLAPELEALDKSQPLAHADIQHNGMEPHRTPPQLASPAPVFERNIDLEDDEIVQAARSQITLAGQHKGKPKVILGRSDVHSTADLVLTDKSQHAANKAAILTALANFDSDDDERDDTYDMADVGGTVDAAVTSGMADAEGKGKERRDYDGAPTADDKEIDIALYRLWKKGKTQFSRDSATRRSKERGALKLETGMTDEAIEGWAMMLERDTKKMSRLEGILALEAGLGTSTQPELPSTAYRRPNPKATSDESDDTQDDAGPSTFNHSQPRGRGGRGRGRGGPGSNRGGRGGRGRGANHRRRDQHAKKMAKAGALPG